MTNNQSDFIGNPTNLHIVVLIPGQHYVVFTDVSDLLPDDDVIEELRILAYAQRNKRTLGPETSQTIETLAEAVASGVISNTVWAECQEAKRFVDKLRSRRRRRLSEAEEAAQHALEAIKASRIPVVAPLPSNLTVSGTGADGTAWKISCKTAGQPVELRMDLSGTVIDVMIGTRS
jgi:hypothetical protein